MAHIDIAFHRRLKASRRGDDFSNLPWNTRAAVITTLRHYAGLGLWSGNGVAQEARQTIGELSGQQWLADVAATALEQFLGGRTLD